MATLRFLKALMVTNLKAAFALRGAFWLQVSFMIANNLIFWTVWLLFFRKFDDLNGWRLPEVTLVYGIAAGVIGLSMVAAGGLRNMAEVITEGDLDLYLTHPKSVILQLAGSRSIASGWGDILSAVLLITMSGVLQPSQIGTALVLVLAGTVIYSATTIAIHSTTFWLGNSMTRLAREMCDYLIMFSVYPQSIYTGGLRILIFTVLPAGFIGYMPVEALREGSWTKVVIVLGAAVVYTAIAVIVFKRGLVRYESGSRLQVRA